MEMAGACRNSHEPDRLALGILVRSCRSVALGGCLILFPALPLSAQTADLEEVACALCHFEQAEEFSESVHYQKGGILCNDCHGGLPFEADAEIAKAPQTGFMGRPQRGDIAAVCGSCHTGPTEFFARGPHHDWRVKANPTCITCHNNHRVHDATLSLMDETCTSCHAAGTTALEAGLAIRAVLEESGTVLQRAAVRLDNLVSADRSLVRVRPLLEAARAALREADPRTHALDPKLIESSISDFRRELEAVETRIGDHSASRRQRRWIVLGVWVFIGLNAFLLWLKSRQLKR